MVTAIQTAPNAPKVARIVKSLRVKCPYCVFGHVDVIELIYDKQVEIENILDPRKCVVCHKYFRLQPRVELVGVPMEDDNGKPDSR